MKDANDPKSHGTRVLRRLVRSPLRHLWLVVMVVKQDTKMPLRHLCDGAVAEESLRYGIYCLLVMMMSFEAINPVKIFADYTSFEPSTIGVGFFLLLVLICYRNMSNILYFGMRYWQVIISFVSSHGKQNISLSRAHAPPYLSRIFISSILSIFFKGANIVNISLQQKITDFWLL